MKKALGVLIFVVLLLGCVSCRKKPQQPEEVFFEVTFITTSLPYEVTPPANATVRKGDAVARPTLDADPTAGYVVIWTTSLTEKTAYDFTSGVEADLTLYATEVPRSYSVIYLIEHGRNVKANPTSFTKATETTYLQKPITDFGYRFIKWAYFDDPDSKVDMIEQGTEGDVVLRAVLEPVEYTIHYVDDGDANPNPETYLFGTTLSLESPLKSGYTFRGYTIAEDIHNTPVTVLTPQFVETNQEAIFHKNGVDIWLQANWEKDE